MGKWEMVRLGDYVKQIRGVSYKPEDTSDLEGETHLPLLRAHNIQKEGLNTNNLVYVNKNKVKSHQYIQKGDIVVCASSGSKELVGKAAQSSVKMNAAFGAFCKVVRPQEGIDSAYLKHYFSSPKYRYVISELSAGANINNLRSEHIDDLQISLPPLEVQRQIADVLDRASTLIEKRKAQIDKLDLLVKSQFIEMFGMVQKNPHNFPIRKLGDVCKKITDGKHGGCQLESGSGYYYVGAREIFDGIIHYGTAQEITYNDFIESYRRCNLENGDLVIVNTGATIGKTAIADNPLTKQTLLQKSVALLKTREEVLIPKFLQYCYMVNPALYRVESSSAQPNLLLSKIRDTEIYVPPMSDQTLFADFVRQVETQKSLLQQSLTKLELNYKSLMQKCFNGEVF